MKEKAVAVKRRQSAVSKQSKKKNGTCEKAVQAEISIEPEKAENIVFTRAEPTPPPKLNVPKLFLAYTYHLNDECTKYISLGYHTRTFTTTILFHHIGVSVLELDTLEFTNIFMLSENISQYFQRGEPIEKLSPNKYIQLAMTTAANGEKQIVFERVGNTSSTLKIALNEKEWNCMLELTNYFNPLLFWYQSSKSGVKHYYDHYVKLCCDTNKTFLTTQEFFAPNEIPNGQMYFSPQPPSYNYSRLFYEIGIFCRYDDILETVLKKIYSFN